MQQSGEEAFQAEGTANAVTEIGLYLASVRNSKKVSVAIIWKRGAVC